MSRRYGRLVRNPQQRRARAPHLLLQQPRRRVRRFALQRVRADQLAEFRRLVRRRQARLSRPPSRASRRDPLRSPAAPPSAPPQAPPALRQSRESSLSPCFLNASAPASLSGLAAHRARSATRPETPLPWRDRNRSPAYSSPAPPNPAAGNPFSTAIAATRCSSALPIPRPRNSGSTNRSSRYTPGPAHPGRIAEEIERKPGRVARPALQSGTR